MRLKVLTANTSKDDANEIRGPTSEEKRAMFRRGWGQQSRSEEKMPHCVEAGSHEAAQKNCTIAAQFYAFAQAFGRLGG